MKRAKLLHNPNAGDEEHTKNDLVKLVKSSGFEYEYASIKKNGKWKEFDGVDFLIAAGGDGTVRTIAKKLLARKLLDNPLPIALLPLGTANNIANALGISGSDKQIVKSWKDFNVKKFDVGKIDGVPESDFFLESFGYGVFPYLMLELKKKKEGGDTPEEKIQSALELLHEIILSYKPRFCELKVDGTDHSGEFLLAEVMNTPSIGPNLLISPHADTGDGEFEVVLVPEQHKDKFADYVSGRISGKEETYIFHTLKAREIQISWDGTHVHVDDTIVKIKKSAEVKIELKAGVLEFVAGKLNGKLPQ